MKHALVVLSLVLFACGKPFDVKTAPGFVALEGQSQHEYRATTPEGVVMGVRVVDDENRGDLTFWTQALVLQLRDSSGYALLDQKDIKSRDGTPGRRLAFAHDESGTPYTYWVTIYLAQGRLFVVEAGGENATFERAKPNVEWMMQSVKVKCDSIVAPVLASRTCNRW
jgi:hypothetical protein